MLFKYFLKYLNFEVVEVQIFEVVLNFTKNMFLFTHIFVQTHII